MIELVLQKEKKSFSNGEIDHYLHAHIEARYDWELIILIENRILIRR